MTLDQARRAAELLHVLDLAQEWLETFASDDSAYVGFSEIVSADNIRMGGQRGGWEGTIGLPRAMAVAMMRWLANHAMDELRMLGVGTAPREGETPP